MIVNYEESFKRGQTVYLVHTDSTSGANEILQIKLRTVFPTYMVGCVNKTKQAVFIGSDCSEMVFHDRDLALKKLKKLKTIE